MTAQPKPKHFQNENEFVAEWVKFRVSDYPAVTGYDSHRVAAAKRKTIAAIEDCATDEAREIWLNHVEHCEEIYERGVGPSWD